MSTDHAPPPPRRVRERRQRTRSFDWWDERERAETVTCPPPPKGCRAAIGVTCTNREGDELTNQPAHQARSRRAAAAEPIPAGTKPANDRSST